MKCQKKKKKTKPLPKPLSVKHTMKGKSKGKKKQKFLRQEFGFFFFYFFLAKSTCIGKTCAQQIKPDSLHSHEAKHTSQANLENYTHTYTYILYIHTCI